MKTYTLSIEGMTCASCVGRVEKALKKVEGVTSAQVNLATEKAVVETNTSPELLYKAVERAGFGVTHYPEINLQIEGMTCASCVGRVEKALKKVDGVISAQVNLATEKAIIQRSQPIHTETLVQAVEKSGFGVKNNQIIELTITGMTCASCVGRVEKALKKVDGVTSAQVNLATENAVIETTSSAQKLIQAVQKAGFDAILKPKKQENRREKEATSLKKDLVLTLCLAVPIFVVEMGSHLIASFHMLLSPFLAKIWYAEFILTTLILVFPARRFYQKGLPALARFSPDMNSLVSVGTLAAYGYSCVATFLPQLLPKGTVNVYFEAAAMITVLILLGRYFEAKAKGKTSQAIQTLVGMQPQTARLVNHQEIAIEDVTAGMMLLIQPGEKIPVDGKITQGQSFVDEAMVTGEPIPVQKQIDDQVIAGTINQHGILHIQTTAVGENTVLSQIIRLVEQAQGSKLPIQSIIDKVTMWFVPVVMGIALITFLGWFIFGPQPALSYSLVNAVAVLIIACPCAMGLATPTSIMVSTGRAAALGILFKKGEALQQLKDTQIIAFDKTGTLTEGKPQLTDLITTLERKDVLAWVAAVEQYSEHPIAKAIVEQAKKEQLVLPTAENIEVLVGYGIRAMIEGHVVYVGADRLMHQQNMDISSFTQEAQILAEQGKTPLYVALNHTVIALIAVSDPIKETTPQAIQALHKMGLKVAMVTGDNQKTAQAIAKQLGIDHVVAEVLPSGKVEAIQKLQQEGKLAYVGDGINDAPALAHADVGIAIGTGTDVAIESADVVLMSGQLTGVTKAIALSHATIKNIHQNLFWAFIYNIILIPVAAGVLYPILLSPMFAAGAMALSSIFVLTNALRLRAFTG